MLSISDFSDMCHLSPQALRFYHAEGLLVPAEVDERTGYRSYDFTQVERAMLVTLLRDAGMSVKQVRQVLDEPDRAVALLTGHRDEVEQQQRAQNEAIEAALSVFAAQPAPELRHAPAVTVVSALVHGTPPGRDAQEWAEAEAMIDAAIERLVAAVTDAGAEVIGHPWRMLDLKTPEDGMGPFWIVTVPVDGPPVQELPDGLEVREEPARDEWSIFIPGRNTMAKFSTMVLRMIDASPDVNTARIRQEVHPDGVRSSAPLFEGEGGVRLAE
ncbi:MerR family transcriptional regulator [Actinoplanes rectilineatus]|uniref:MerR family transcriptional regulator n=1 Tax=Actinoplanes rectilineatus TaxID=113571 RepID=UPI0005F2D9C0|nr:MerR family transcriptional regulator [Actinoplanes rectilineatus]